MEIHRGITGNMVNLKSMFHVIPGKMTAPTNKAWRNNNTNNEYIPRSLNIFINSCVKIIVFHALEAKLSYLEQTCHSCDEPRQWGRELCHSERGTGNIPQDGECSMLSKCTHIFYMGAFIFIVYVHIVMPLGLLLCGFHLIISKQFYEINI